MHHLALSFCTNLYLSQNTVESTVCIEIKFTPYDIEKQALYHSGVMLNSSIFRNYIVRYIVGGYDKNFDREKGNG